MTSSTTRAFMAKKPFATASAFMAKTNQLLSTMASLRLLLVMFLTLTVSAEVWGANLVFNFTTPVTNWPTSSQAGNYIYELNSTSYTFILGNNVYCNSGYLMLKSTTTLGLPAIEGMKLTKIVVHNSSGCSTSTNVSVCSNTTGTTVSGGNGQVFSKTDKDYTYNLSNTLDNTVYYLRITTKNCQITKLTLTYETAAASCDKKVSLTKGAETNGTFTLDKENGSYDNCDENFVVKVSNIVPKSSSQYCNGINVTGGNSSVTGPVDGVWTVTYAKENNITSTITPTYADKAPANISFENMGNPTPTTTGYYVGDTYTLPATNDYTCGDKTFVGWSTVIIENSQTKPTAATYFEPGASVTLAADQTFYAVFAEASGDGEEGWQKVMSTDQVIDGKIYAFISFDETYYLANAQSTNDPTLKNISKTNGAIESSDDMKWSAGSQNDGGFVFTSCANTNYYLWGGSGNDAIRVNTTSTKNGATNIWYIEENNTYGVIIHNNANKYLSTYGTSNWRNYASNNLSEDNRVANLYIFTAGTTYSDYTTQCTTEPSTSTYTVKHCREGLEAGSYPDNLIVTETPTGTIGEQVTPGRKNYTGFTAPSGQTETILENGALVVTYKYTRNSYTLTWELGDGIVTTEGTEAPLNATGTISQSVRYETPITAPIVQREGYRFNKWNTSVSDQMPASDKSFTATWVKTWDITWKAQGNIIQKVTVDADSKLTLPTEEVATCEGMTHIGWTENEIYTSDTDAPDDFFTYAIGTVSENKIYHAVYALSCGYTKLDWGSEVPEGKYLISTGTNTIYGQNGNTKTYLGATAYAPTRELKPEYEVYIREVGTAFAIQLLNTMWVGWASSTDTKLTIDSPETDADYTWKYTENGIQNQSATSRYLQINGAGLEGRVYTTAGSGSTWHPTYLYARNNGGYYTTCQTSVAIDYDLNGGTGNMSNTRVKSGSDYIIPTAVPTQVGKTFTHWSDGTNTYAAGATINDLTNDITLTAQWKVAQHTVTLNPNYPNGKTGTFTYEAGELVDGNLVLTYDYNTASMTIASLYTSLTLDGYEFGGWYNAKGVNLGEVSGSKCTNTGNITGDKTYYAKWSKLHTVTFNTGTNNPTVDAMEGTSETGITLPAGPTPACSTDGWTFAGWTTESVSETTTTPDPLYAAGSSYTPTSDITLYAVYTKTEGGGGTTAQSITTYQDGTYYLIDSFTDAGKNTTYHSPKGTGTKIPSEDMTEYVSVNDNVLTLNLTNAPLTEDMKYTISKENNTYKIYNAETEAYVGPTNSTNFSNSGESEWSINDKNNRFMFYSDTRAFLYQDSYNNGGTKTYGRQFGNYARSEAGTTDNQEGKECYGSGYFFLVPATNSTTTYNSNPECCQQPRNPLTITADQTELIKNGIVQLTATGGNGRLITWSTTSGSLTNQSNTGATLTINDVATTQTITVTASQEENDDDEPICEQEATIDITVKTQWTIKFQTNDNGVKNSNSIIVTDGDSYTMPDISDEYVCTGSTSFAGWRSTETDGEPEQVAGSAVKATTNTTWYAVWITTNAYTTETRDKYELVTKTSQQITQNDVVIITYANGGVALGQMTEEDLYGSPVAVDFSADKSYLTFAEGTAVMPLKVLWWDDADDDFDGWYFEDNANTGHYLTYSGKQGGTLYYETDGWMWDINITSQNNATISDTEEGYDQYNLQYNSSNSRFAFYTSSQKKVQLYRKNGTISIQIPSDPTYTTNNTSCTRGAVISAEDGKWVTAANGQKVRTAINVTARGFESAATLSATSNNPNFVVSLPNPSISASTVVNTTLNVEYTPTTAETTETAQITLTAGETTQTITVNGRSLPDEFVIVAQYGDKWLALPANMQSGADQYNGIEVTPNNTLTQIPAAPSTTIYSLRGVADNRYEEAGTCVRLVGNGNKCLWGNASPTNTTIQNWTTLGATNGSNYEWLLTTSDGELYTIANPAHPDYNQGRILSNSGSKYGLYKGTTKFYILPVGCSSMPANVQVSPRRVDATFSWESNANSTTIDVYTNEAMTSGNISKTASSSPCFFDGLKELTQYWYKITPDGNATCAVTGSFTTTGPTIDVVEWKENQVVIFVDKDKDVNPLVIIDGEVEHNTGSTSATDLFFSKYFEAQGTAKLLAIYNGTTNALPLEEITILHRSKDKNTPLSLASFGKTPGWIQPSEEIILYNVDDREEVMDCAEEDPTFPSWNNVEDGNLAFSGKGTIRLFRGNTCIDIIGAMNSIDDMNNMDASPIEGSEKPEFGDDKGFSTSTGDNYATDAEENNYALSTNRCLLVRKPSVTSGTNAITNNIGDFKTLGNDFTGIANEWAGLQIPNGPSENQFQYTCEGFKEVGSFDYNKYYKEYNNIDGDTYLDSYAHDDETHEYTIDIENLAQYSCLNIRFQLKQGDQILTEAPVQVPIIVNDDKTTDDAIFNQIVKGNTAMSIERCATCNVVVLNNATLTKATDGTTNDVPTIGNLKVYPGGSVIVPNGTNYTINSLALRRQEDEIAMANIQGTLNIKQTKSVYLDVRIDPTNWHYISLPHDCRVGDIFFTDGTPAILNTDYLLGWYDGAYRAEHKTGGWTYITDNDYILKRGLGYIIALPGTDKIKRELRFPMANKTITEDKGDKEIGGLYAYGGDKSDQELGPNHKGWNMIGNPYLYTYTADIVKEPLQMGTLSKYGDPWDGSWERTGDARYIVEPIDNGWSGYRQTTITNLKPFTSYFIQIGGEKEGDDYTTVTPETNQSIVFNANSIARSPSSIVRRDTPAEEVEDNHPVWYGIELLAPNNEKDNTTLLISNNFTDGYDMMDDLVKMRGDYYQYYNYPVLASRNDEGEMAFNALPDNSAARVGVPLNYYAAVAGTYTITTDGRFDLEEVKSAILYDTTTAQECDLLLEDYTFTTAKGNNSDRFTLFVTVERKKAPSIPTGKDNLLTDGQLSLITIDRTLVLSGLTDKADIYVYDMTGKLIIGAHNSGDNGIWRTSVPTSGVYFVRVNGKTEAQTIKAVVK